MSRRAALLAMLCLLTLSVGSDGQAVRAQEPAVAGNTSAVPAGQAKEHLQRILQERPFQRWHLRQAQARGEMSQTPSWFREYLRHMREMIGGFFKGLIERLFGNRNSGSASSWNLPTMNVAGWMKLIGWILAVAVGLFLLHATVKLIREHQASRSGAVVVSRRQIDEALESGAALAAESPVWLHEADRLADEHDLRRAYRAIYLALLSGLHSSGRIDFRRQRTNWTYVNHFRGDPARRQSFAGLTALFDDVWYGLREPQAVALGRIKQQVRELLTQEVAHG